MQHAAGLSPSTRDEYKRHRPSASRAAELALPSPRTTHGSAQVLEDKAMKRAPVRLGDAAGRGQGRAIAILEHIMVVDRIAAGGTRPFDRSNMPLGPGAAFDATELGWAAARRLVVDHGFAEALDELPNLLRRSLPERPGGAAPHRVWSEQVHRSVVLVCAQHVRAAGRAGNQPRSIGLLHGAQQPPPGRGILVPELHDHVAI